MRHHLLARSGLAVASIALVLAGCTNGYQRDDFSSRWSREDTFIPENAEEAEALRRIRSAIDAAQKLTKHPEIPETEKEALRQAVGAVRAALRHYEKVRDRGDVQAIIYAGVGTASSAIVADNVTVVGFGDDIGLIPLALLALAAHILTDSKASPQELTQAWLQVGYRLQELAAVTEYALQFAAPGNQVDTGIMDEVYAEFARRGLPPDDNDQICATLRQWYEEARRLAKRAKDRNERRHYTERVKRINKTMKAQQCRHSRHSD